MHEYSVVRSILRQVEQAVGVEARESVREIRVSVGEFSGVDLDLLLMAFDQVMAEQGISKRRLVVHPTTLCAECRECGTEFAPVSFVFLCPLCGARETRIVCGEELILESITLQE